MNAPFSLLTVLAFTLLSAVGAEAQTLTCPPTPGGTSRCAGHHFHVQIWNSESKTFTELYGINAFSTLPACEAARQKEAQSNEAVLSHLRRLEPKTKDQPNRYGACHCDLTWDVANLYLLDDGRRFLQKTAEANSRASLRGKLLDEKTPSDSPLVQSLASSPSPMPADRWTKDVPLPEASPRTRTQVSEADLRDTTVGSERRTVSNMQAELQLVDVPVGVSVSPALLPAEELPQQGESEPLPSSDQGSYEAPEQAEAAAPSPGPSAAPQSESSSPVAEQRDEEEYAGVVDRYFSYETARVQNILKANQAVIEEEMKKRVFETAMQRLQLLTNLRAVIDAAGSKSRLAGVLRMTTNEEARLALVANLFGNDMPQHWAPKDAKDVIFEAESEVESDPIGVLRDATGRFSPLQKRHALYHLLSHTQSFTSTQELWLAEIVNSLIPG